MTYIILAITIIVSIIAMNNKSLFYKLQFNAYQVVHRKQWYRLLSHGLVHSGWWHLGINMFVLWSFGTNVEGILFMLSDSGVIKHPVLIYIFLYISALIISSSISLVQHKDNHWYNAVGASGAVSAVVYFSIFFFPVLLQDIAMSKMANKNAYLLMCFNFIRPKIKTLSIRITYRQYGILIDSS